jgi:hypothetical protein
MVYKFGPVHFLQIFFACLKLKQKAAVRIVLGANYNDHTEPIFKHLNILPLDALRKFFDLQFMQNFI